MLDFTKKKFVRSFNYSNFREDRTLVKEVRINGRSYLKRGTKCATTCVAHYWKVFDESVNRFKNVYLVGVARQHPDDRSATYAEGIEIAAENAMISPVMTLVYDEPAPFELIEHMMEVYVAGLEERFVRTKEESEINTL